MPWIFFPLKIRIIHTLRRSFSHFSNGVRSIHTRAPKTIHFHMYISMFRHDLSILQKKLS